MSWVTVDEAQVMGAMSVETLEAYAAWVVAHPEKSGRLAAICGSVVAEFRGGIATNPANVLDPDPAKLPDSCLRHGDTLIVFELKGEMGATITAAETVAVNRAEIFLRQLYYSHFVVAAGGTAAPSPSYGPAAERPEPSLEG